MLSTVASKIRRLAVCCAVLAALSSSASIASAAPANAEPGAQVADLAQQFVGSRYIWGGASPSGFDCTGFVMYVLGQFGVSLPHSEAGQLAAGERVSVDELQPGDVLVFANTYRRGLSHAGIYIGDGQFVHAVDERHGVQINNLWDAYWAPRFAGASRTLV